MSTRVRWRWWWFGSLAFHAAAVSTAFVAAPTFPQRSASRSTVEFEWAPPVVSNPGAPGADDPSRGRSEVRLPLATPESLGGAHEAQNIDTHERGERGDGRSLERGQLLAERDEGVNLSPHLMNTLRADQENRIDTSSTRRSPQFRRSTPNPGYDAWVSLQDGILLYRLPQAPTLPARGAIASPNAGASAGRTELPPTPASTGPGTGNDQSQGGAPHVTAGVTAPVGTTHRAAGPSAEGHAAILSGHASTTSDLRAERPSDDVDAETLATTLLRNSVAASLHAGPDRAAGVGGVGGGGAPGSGGGHDAGGRARPYGEGSGWMSLSSPDGRYMRYFQDVRRSLDPLWAHAFPQEEAMQFHQGTVILRFVIQSDGRVTGAIVQRRSGIDAFDHNVLVAVAAARLPPIPPALGLNEIRVTAPFVFRNPIVR